jgi:hypothetical protein
MAINDYRCASPGYPRLRHARLSKRSWCNPPPLFDRPTRANPHFRYQQPAPCRTISAGDYQSSGRNLPCIPIGTKTLPSKHQSLASPSLLDEQLRSYRDRVTMSAHEECWRIWVPTLAIVLTTVTVMQRSYHLVAHTLEWKLPCPTCSSSRA